jgi:hypothetical protein
MLKMYTVLCSKCRFCIQLCATRIAFIYRIVQYLSVLYKYLQTLTRNLNNINENRINMKVGNNSITFVFLSIPIKSERIRVK